MHEISISSNKRVEFIDITGQVQSAVDSSGITDGAALIFTKHTTTGLIINENESGLLKDFENMLKKLVPLDDYFHDRIDNNADAHLRSVLLNPSVIVPIVKGRLRLGTWQRIFLVELDGPRNRRIAVSFCKAP